MKKLLLPLSALLVAPLAVAETEIVTIVDHITSGTTNIVSQPEELLKRLIPVEGVEEVQVFSDNNARTAKNEARSKQRIISSRFPQYQTYVMYTSPYWRLKVGDFRTQQEANNAAEELRRAFPAYSKEIRVVRDRVTVHE